MKIIIINDVDGHTWGLAFTPENITKVREWALERGITTEDLNDEPYGLPVGRRWASVCEVIDTDHMEVPVRRSNPFV